MGARPHVRAGTSIYQSDGTRIVNLRSPSRRSSLSFGKSSTVINNLRTGSRSTQSVFREKLVRESNVRKKKRKRKKMSPPRIFVRRCIKQISLPLARRYPSLYPNKSFIIELRSISLSIVLIHIEGIQNGFPSRFFPLKSPPPRLISTLPYSSLPIDHHPRFSSTVPR